MRADDDTTGAPAGTTTEAGPAPTPERARRRPREDWAWRARIRADPKRYHAYRTGVAVVGTVVVVVGLALVPLPGPGWVIVFLGLKIFASEFERAKAVERFVVGKVRAWTRWMARQHWGLRLAAGALTCAFVLVVVWLLLVWQGVPTVVPEGWYGWVPGLAPAG